MNSNNANILLSAQPTTPHSAPAFPSYFLGVGLAQGLLAWLLAQSTVFSPEWRTNSPLFAGALYAIAMVPMAIYFTHRVPGMSFQLRLRCVGICALVFAALGASAAWDAAGGSGRVFGASQLGTSALGFVGLTLLVGFDFKARRWVYARLFEMAWRNGTVSVAAYTMVGLFWALLWAGGFLMAGLGVDRVKALIEDPIFYFVVSPMVYAAAFGLGLVSAAFTEAIRRFLLALTAWLLPLVLLFAVMWVVSLPFTGLGPFLATGSAAAYLLWACAVAIVFAASAYQDGQIAQPFPRLLCHLTQWAWLALVPMLLVAVWDLGQHIALKGLSENSTWALFAALVIGVHVIGYAGSVLRRGVWMSTVAKTNVVGALVFCGGMLALLPTLGAR